MTTKEIIKITKELNDILIDKADNLGVAVAILTENEVEKIIGVEK